MTFRQTADIALTGGNFTPIGNNGKEFNGIYDGGNHTISGLTVSQDYGNIGLFGVIGDKNIGATVKNVVLLSPTVTATDASKYSASVGPVVGMSNDRGTVENCIVINPTLTTSGTNKIAGAIVGQLYYNTNTMKDCYFYDSNTDHSYAALGENSQSSTVTNVARAFVVNATDCTVSSTPTFSVGGTAYYIGEVTITATIPSSDMKKFTATGRRHR